MANTELNPVLLALHGHVGDLVFKTFEGRTIVAKKAKSHQPNTPAQLAVREKFRLAAAYGKIVFANPAIKALYAAKAKEKRVNVFSLILGDFLKAPKIDEVDLSAYAGRTGDVIRIRATDDFEVTSVSVQMREPDTGEPIDGGAATLGSDGIWAFTAQANVPHDHPFVIEVSATDRPGHKTLNTQTHTVH